MEKMVEQGLLYDFYGELLTPHQRKIYEDAVYNDLSPSEIAQEQGISRQGIHDLIKRCNGILEGYEKEWHYNGKNRIAKLHLVARFNEIKSKVQEMNALAEDDSVGQEQLRREIKNLSDEILKAL